MFKPLSKQIKTAEILFTVKEPFTAESTEVTEKIINKTCIARLLGEAGGSLSKV